MAPLFERHGVTVVALSKDAPSAVHAHRQRDSLTLTLLSDPELKVITAFGLLHQKAIQFWTFDLLGLPLGFPRGFKTMAIPTTLLVDEGGAVRWIDQADDYRVRGDEARVTAAVEGVFGGGATPPP